jgi:hypothetical protein
LATFFPVLRLMLLPYLPPQRNVPRAVVLTITSADCSVQKQNPSTPKL